MSVTNGPTEKHCVADKEARKKYGTEANGVGEALFAVSATLLENEQIHECKVAYKVVLPYDQMVDGTNTVPAYSPSAFTTKSVGIPE